MAGKVCLFDKCHGPPRWKHYGIATKVAVTYSKLLKQKRSFQEFIEFNNMQIMKSGKLDSYCIVDKKYSLSAGNNIDIFIFDEETNHSALYLEYSMHKQYIIENCKDLLTFLNFSKNSTVHLQDSFIYVKSCNRLKWVLFFSMLEFLIQNLNMSIIGSQFYFPLHSKYLIRNELQSPVALKNLLKGCSSSFRDSFNKTCKPSKLSLKKCLPSAASHSVSRFQNQKKNLYFPSEQVAKKMKNLNLDTCKAIQKLQLKRKSVDSCTGYDCLPKTKRFNSEKNVCECKIYSWKIFRSFKKDSILNYSSILDVKKSMIGPEALKVFPPDCCFQKDWHNVEEFCNPSQSIINQDPFTAVNTSEKCSPSLQLPDKVIELKNNTVLSLEETKEIQPKSEQISGFQTLKDMKVASEGKGNFKKEEVYPSETMADKSQKHIAGPSGENLPKVGFIGINKHSVTFQTASGKSLKISEAALQAAEKMFDEISAENLDIFPAKNTQKALPKTAASDKHCVGFQTASGKSLHASKTALEAAEKMFKEIKVEENDIFPEKLTQTKQNKECYPSLKDSVDDDISKDLAENFFEDISFDEKEIDSKPAQDPVALSVQKPETSKTTQTHKKRKSLGGRRSLKPYSLKK